MHDRVGAERADAVTHGARIGDVDLGMPRRCDLGSMGLEDAHDVRAHEAGAAGDVDPHAATTSSTRTGPALVQPPAGGKPDHERGACVDDADRRLLARAHGRRRTPPTRGCSSAM